MDAAPQPNYPYEFHKANALSYPLEGFDIIHASPPCHAFSALRAIHPEREYPDLVPAIRARLLEAGVPYVLENVVGAPLLSPTLLCGAYFGLGAHCADGRYRPLKRHRIFETPIMLMGAGCACGPTEPLGVYGKGGRQVRGYMGTRTECAAAMDISWMSRAELSQAIPPAYTHWIGTALLEQLLVPCPELGGDHRTPDNELDRSAPELQSVEPARAP